MAEPQPAEVVAVRGMIQFDAPHPDWTYIVIERSGGVSQHAINRDKLAPWTSRELREAYDEMFEAHEALEATDVDEGEDAHEFYDEPPFEHTLRCPGCMPLIKAEERFEAALARVRAAKETQQ